MISLFFGGMIFICGSSFLIHVIYVRIDRWHAEVADCIAWQLDGLDIEVPFNVVTPSLRDELVKRGVKISKPENSNAGRASLPAYKEWLESRGGEDGKVKFAAEEKGGVIDEEHVYFFNTKRAVKGIKVDEATGKVWFAKIKGRGGFLNVDHQIFGLARWLDKHKGKKSEEMSC